MWLLRSLLYALFLITLALLCVGLFSNCMVNDWAFDDYLAIYNNKDVAENANYVDLWRHDIWGKSLLAHDSHRSFRPLLVVVFKLLRHFFGLEHWAFLVASVSAHYVVCVLLFYTGTLVLGSETLSLGATLLFATHPVHVEVSYSYLIMLLCFCSPMVSCDCVL
jgi:protein O-mannosyl-transferase